MENKENWLRDVEMEKTDHNEGKNRKAYWLMISPFEKEVINKMRNNEVKICPKDDPIEKQNK